MENKAHIFGANIFYNFFISTTLPPPLKNTDSLPQPAHRRQSALQHLQPFTLLPLRLGKPVDRSILHAAKQSSRAHYSLPPPIFSDAQAQAFEAFIHTAFL